MDAIEAKGLSKTYRDFWRRPSVTALDSLDLTVGAGEVFGLLGPNGSGKSTTVKLILGLLKPTAGSISVLGGSPLSSSVKERIGYLPEVSELHKFLTPRETLMYYCGLFGLDGRTSRERTSQLLKMVGLEKNADREIAQFSKGMARRVAIAQSLVNNPDLLVFDEPTSGLDPIAGSSVKTWISLLAQAGKTILMTSHILGDVEDVCSRVAIICDGRLRRIGTVEELVGKRDPSAIKLEKIFIDAVNESDRENNGGAVRAAELAPFLMDRR